MPCSSVNSLSRRNCVSHIYVALKRVMKDELLVFNRFKLHVLYNRFVHCIYNTCELVPYVCDNIVWT